MNEETRLAALHSLALLDTPPEERFDRFTRLAQRMFGVSIALLSLVDRDRQYFKSRCGVDLTGIPRSGSFCSYALQHEGAFVVEDASADPRFRDSDLVAGAGIRFYAGAALETLGGERIGTLCLLDTTPRRFGEQERVQLADLARMLERELQAGGLEGAQQEAEAAREELRRFFSLSLDMLCVAGTDGYFKKLNPAWEATLGWTIGDLTGRPYLEFVHPEDRERTISEARLLELGNITVAFENRYRCKDGSYRHLLWSAVTDQSSGLIYCVTRDISALRGAEEELRRSRARAEAAGQARSRFLTHMSREFRTPLNAVLGFTNMLLEDSEAPTARQRTFLEGIQANGRDLLFLVNDILDLAQVEAGHSGSEPEPVDLGDMIAAVIARLDLQARQKGLELRSDVPAGLVPLPTDARHLKQVLLNLAGNAVKFTSEGRVTIRVVPDAAGSRPERIEIEDTGAGISYELQDEVYVAFHQTEEGHARRYAGTGLGLTVSRAWCERLGFRLQLWSRLGSGTTFTIYLVPSARA